MMYVDLGVASMSGSRFFKIVGVFVLVAFAGGCTRQQLGLPRVAADRVSPNGNHRAWVKNHLSFDPPAQSLWIRDLRTKEAKRVLLLAEDQDWCRTIEWSSDGSVVVFLVQDGRAVVYSPADGRVVADRWLVHRESYPTDSYAADVSFSPNGESLIYRECRRSTDECSDWISHDLGDNPGVV
jgi:WD40 repeat protein